MYRFVNLFLIIVAINFYGNVQCSSSKEGLLLTPLIKAGRIAEARSSARVVLPNAPQVESYSGYLTVNKETGSNLFFWFFPSKVRLLTHLSAELFLRNLISLFITE